MLIAAGVNAKAITAYLATPRSRRRLTFYGHLMPDNDDEAVPLVDAYLERANTDGRLAQID